MKNKLLSILLGLCMVVTLMPAAAWADVDVNSYENPEAGGGVPAAQSGDAHSHYLCGGDTCTKVGHDKEDGKTPFKAWSNTTELPSEAGNYYLTANVTLSSMWQPQNDVVLCLNGKTIMMQDSGAVINMSAAGKSLTLTDCAPEGKVGKVTHIDNKAGSGVSVAGNSTFTLYGGSISGNNADRGNGGGVYVGVGTFNMYGGSISGNTADYGGGVHVYGGTFTMSGGSISGNNAGYDGGGVFVETGTFTMSGGSISGNNANNGGVYVNTNGTFTMSGGSISGNNANNGGGVCVKGTFELEDGSITGNYAGGTLSATGVYEKGENGTDNNVYLCSGKTIDVSGLDTNAGEIGVTTRDTPAANSTVTIATGAKDGVDYSKIFTPDVTDQDYTITSAKGNVYLNAHTHSWAYSVSSDGATITAMCTGCNQSGGTLTIKAPVAGDLTYNGSAKAATVTTSDDWEGENKENIIVNYIKQGESTSSNTAPKNAGTYTASIKLGDAEASVTYTIAKANPQASDFTFTAPTDLSYNGDAKEATVAANTGITGMGEVTVKYFDKDGKSVAAADVKNAGDYTVKIDVAAGDNFKDITDLTDENWKFTIAQATYTDKKTATANAVINPNGTDVYVKLPELPDGASYGTVTLGDTTDMDGNPQDNIFASGYGAITDGKLHLRVESQTAGLTAHVKVAVTGAKNYKDYDIDITVTTIDKMVADVSVTAPSGVSCGDTITLTPSVTDESGTNGMWGWMYDREPFQFVQSNDNTGELKVKAIKAGEATITFTYTSDTHEGSKDVTFTVGKKMLTRGDLTGVPEKLTKVYDGTDKHNAIVSLGLTDSAKINENEQAQINISANDITYAQSNVGETTATLSLKNVNLGPNYGFAVESIEAPAEITKATPTVSGTGIATGTYGQKLSEVTVNGLNATLNGETVDGSWKLTDESSDTLDTITTSGSTIQYTAVFTPTDTKNYNSVEATVDVTVNPKSGGSLGTVNLTQKYTDTTEKKYGPNWTGLPAGETWSYNGNVVKSDDSITLGKKDLAVNGTTLTYSISGGQAGDTVTFTLTATCSSGHYEPFTITVVVKLVEKDPQSDFKFAETSKTKTYGDADFTIQATGAETGSTVTYSSSDENVATVDNTGEVTIKGAGTATISATASETTDYAEKTVSYTLTVNKKQITAPTADSTTFTYNGEEQTYKLDENEAYTITGNTQKNANESGYTVTVSLKDKNNTEWADKTSDDKTYSFVIKKAKVTIAAKNLTEYVGKIAPTLGEDSYTVSGLFGEDKLTTNPAIKYVDADGNEVTPDMTKTGETIIRVSGAAASENYTISYIYGKLTVSAAPSGGGSSIQRPTIIADTGADTKLSYNGRTLTIAAEEGYEITDVLVNGVSKGKVTEVTGLRTGDKVEVKAAKKAEPTDPAADKNAKLIKGVGNTTIILKSKLTKAGKVLLTWTKSKGYKVDYFEVYRSVKKNSGYGKKPFFTTKDGNWSKYLNTKELKAGKTYYYKVRGVRVIDGKKYYTKYSNKAWRTIK